MKGLRFALLWVLVIMLTKTSISSPKNEIATVKWPWLNARLKSKSDTTYVINFWATWCVPCVAELPDFEKIHRQFLGQKVKVILISLDHAKKIRETVIPFAAKKKMTAQIVLLNEADANSWIDRIDPDWSGALPATIILNNANAFRRFFEKELNFETLNQLIQQSFLKK